MDLTAEQQENWPIFLSSCGGPNLSLSLTSHPPWTPAIISGRRFGGTPGSCSRGLLCLCRCRIYPQGGKGPAGVRRPCHSPPSCPCPALPDISHPTLKELLPAARPCAQCLGLNLSRISGTAEPPPDLNPQIYPGLNTWAPIARSQTIIPLFPVSD